MEQERCRLCLLPVSKQKTMHLFKINTTYNFVDLINTLFNITVSENDYFSKLICRICFITINTFNDYSVKVKLNNQYLIQKYCGIIGKDDNDLSNIHERLTDNLLQNVESKETNDIKADHYEKCEIQNNSDSILTSNSEEYVTENIENTYDDKNIIHQDSNNSENAIENVQNIEPQIILEEKSNKTSSKNSKRTSYSETANDREIKKFYKYECDLCNNHGDITTFRIFKHHYRDQHGIAAYIRCCGKRFTKPYQLVEHIEEHLAPESLVCPTCNKTLRTKQTLIYHMDKHVPIAQRPLKCKHCDSRFVRKHHLTQHERMHLEDKKCVCNLCGKRFPFHWLLKKHVETSHSDEKRFFCEKCGKAFKSNVQLKNHFYIHNNKDEPYKECAICGVCCRSPRQYYAHMREKHDESTPKSFPCEKCSHISPSKKALYAHTLNKHGPKILNCSLCTEAFSSTSLLKSHMIKHTGPGEPLKCPYCPKTFSFRSGLYSHRKRVHPDMIITNPNKK